MKVEITEERNGLPIVVTLSGGKHYFTEKAAVELCEKLQKIIQQRSSQRRI